MERRKYSLLGLVPCISSRSSSLFSHPRRFHVLPFSLFFSFPSLSFSRIHPRSIVCILDAHTLYPKRIHAYECMNMRITSAIGNISVVNFTDRQFHNNFNNLSISNYVITITYICNTCGEQVEKLIENLIEFRITHDEFIYILYMFLKSI